MLRLGHIGKVTRLTDPVLGKGGRSRHDPPCRVARLRPAPEPRGIRPEMTRKVEKTNAEWRELLNREQYHVTREHGTERALLDHFT